MLEEIKNLLVTELNIENPDDITLEASLGNDLGINSLELADLVLLCEEKFNITVDDEEAQNFKTLGDIVRYLEAAADLGCNNRKTLLRVILPLTMPGVVSGVTMVFVPSISTFYISQKLGGGVFDLLGDTIERQFQNAVTYHTGAAISLVMMVLILISLAIMNKFSDKGEDIII